ncbi:MAG: carboxynorspermidine decarboxylase [Clostridiales bacterium]|nr:carboxynorspermidine decarboxylase [Clostridiales bacterium]
MQLSQIPTPVYVIDEDKLIKNLEILAGVQERTGCKILLAQKAFSCYHFYPLIAKFLAGATASGLYEAKLAHDEMGGENHVFCPAYLESEFGEITEICDHIVFNSVAQVKKFALLAKGRSLGLRINPEHSTQSSAIYDPCAKGSRLGVTKAAFSEDVLSFLDGFHIHTLCEQGAEDMISTVRAFEKNFGQYFKKLKWLNLGGGHHITKEGYNIPLLESEIKRLSDKYSVQIYLEPGEAIALNAGYLYTKVLEIVHNDIDIAILDTSAECHMPDVLEMPYRPPLKDSGEAGEKKYTYRLSSRTCLAGDVIGDYSFDKPLKCGDTLRFDDMAIYSMVKNNTFNGMPLPAIAKVKNGEYSIIKTFGYADFKGRLS